MMRLAKVVFVFILFFSFTNAQQEISSLAGKPGVFSRMGFGARGISMGNTMASITEGNIIGLYNPALTSFQKGNSFHSGYSFLSMDRSLNFLSFTRKFTIGSKEKGNESTAGISLGLINAGVRNIEERDIQGNLIGDLSTSENLFFGSISKTFGDRIAVGLNLKFYYYNLYKDVNTSSFGIDFGVLYKPIENLNLSFLLTDLNSSYNWDSTPLYDIYGVNEKVDFPMLYKFGTSYNLDFIKTLVSAEYEASNLNTSYFRFGLEYNVYGNLFLRGGIDRLNLSNFDEPALPALGFGYSRIVGKFNIGIDYAFVYESVTISDRHIFGIVLNL